MNDDYDPTEMTLADIIKCMKKLEKENSDLETKTLQSSTVRDAYFVQDI